MQAQLTYQGLEQLAVSAYTELYPSQPNLTYSAPSPDPAVKPLLCAPRNPLLQHYEDTALAQLNSAFVLGYLSIVVSMFHGHLSDLLT